MLVQTKIHRGNMLSMQEWSFTKPYRWCNGRSTSYLHQPGPLLINSERLANRPCECGSSIQLSRSSENLLTTFEPSILGSIVLRARPRPYRRSTMSTRDERRVRTVGGLSS